MFDGIHGNLDRVHVSLFRINRHLNLGPYHLQLFYGGRTIDVTSHKKGVATFLMLQQIGKFSGERSLSRSLQPCHQDHRRTPLQVDIGELTSHQQGQFIMHQLHHQLAWFYRCKNVHTDGFLLNRIGKCLCRFEIHIGIQKRPSDFLQRFRNIDLGNPTLSLQKFKGPFQLFTQIFKHSLFY